MPKRGEAWPRALKVRSTISGAHSAKADATSAGANSTCGDSATAECAAVPSRPCYGTERHGCDAGYHPNGLGDATINVTSHEHNETITDENGNAWYDLRGYEDGDKCAWSWGAITGNYNQTINGHHYIAQLEYSNADRGCVQQGL